MRLRKMVFGQCFSAPFAACEVHSFYEALTHGKRWLQMLITARLQCYGQGGSSSIAHRECVQARGANGKLSLLL
jgi:hypothetical protein